MTSEPYEYLSSYSYDEFKFQKVKTLLSNQAQKVGFKGFNAQFKAYATTLVKKEQTYYLNNVTTFENQPIELECGGWKCDDGGISITGFNGTEEYACMHPILPTKRLKNVDTGEEKIEIAFCRRGRWQTIVVDKKTISNVQSITNLSNFGVCVTSENARLLIKYLSEIEQWNEEKIPEYQCTTRLGWIDNKTFVPYIGDLVFDGDCEFSSFFNSVIQKGKYIDWFTAAWRIRSESIVGRIVLAASFASCLVKPLGCLPFFVHLWGGTEVGKTVALMVAASVWADPAMGKYIHTFNSTSVGQERLAIFLNSLPLALDELQISRSENRKIFDKIIYTLCEGVGRTRGNKSGGIDKTGTWLNTMITSGETPIISENSGAGAVNRIIEIECKDKIFKEPREIVKFIKSNYGFAGQYFVEDFLENEPKVKELYEKYIKDLSETEATEKQIMAAALILTADDFATEMIFKDNQSLTISDLIPLLVTKNSISSEKRAYEYLCDWISQNANKLRPNDSNLDVYGLLEDNTCYIIKSVFDKVLIEANYSPKSVLSYLKTNDLLICDFHKNTKKQRINKIPTNCVCVKLLSDCAIEFVEDDEIPF
ncbi:MAG: DUF927 domain-containing protein [Oscillospiraceae bacterium]|jgi:uncharacterized protein (DUF927 family)|nr:DUF927 domain-containing protein [Oscillospiraceae bacterium]